MTIAERLAEPFPQRDLGVKPQSVKGNRALVVYYIDARMVMQRLDEVLGIGNWQDEYDVLNDGSVVCRLRVRLGPENEWIAKVDVGSPSEQPDAGDRLKAAFSDGLKRAAVKLGVARYVYDLPLVWADYDPVKKQFTSLPNLPASALPRPKTQTGQPAQSGQAPKPPQAPPQQFQKPPARSEPPQRANPQPQGAKAADSNSVYEDFLFQVGQLQTVAQWNSLRDNIAAVVGQGLIPNDRVQTLRGSLASSYKILRQLETEKKVQSEPQGEYIPADAGDGDGGPY